jgi:hypothetical protein
MAPHAHCVSSMTRLLVASKSSASLKAALRGSRLLQVEVITMLARCLGSRAQDRPHTCRINSAPPACDPDRAPRRSAARSA